MKAPQAMSDFVELSPDAEAGSSAPIAILRTFVLNNKTHVLSGLAELSYIAGREGDDEWDWSVEVGEALIDAFFASPLPPTTIHPRSARFQTARAILEAAFRGGVAQREIDMGVTGRARVSDYSPQQLQSAKVCERAMSFARAHATIYLAEIEFPADRHPHAIESAIWRVAKKVAWRHAVTGPEAAYCALKAFEETGLAADWSTAAEAMDGAASGLAEREAEEENARERAAEIASATAGLFGGGE